jgi:hypothetical protein
MTSSNAPSGKGSGLEICRLQVRAVAEPPPGQLQHLRAGVDAGDDRASLAQRRQEGAGAAADVEDPPPRHLASQVQDCRPRVVAVDEGLIGPGSPWRTRSGPGADQPS